MAPALLHHLSRGEELLLRLHRARAGHHNNFLAADLDSVGKLNDGVVFVELAPREFVRRADTMHALHARQHLEVTGVEVDALAHRGQHTLPRAGGAMHGKAHLHQVIGHPLDLVFAGVFQHRNDHGFALRLSLFAIRSVILSESAPFVAWRSRSDPYNLEGTQ